MDPDAARALLAGFIAGAAAAFATTAIALVAVTRSPRWQARLGAAPRLPLLGVVLANALFLAWSLLGLVLGAVFIGVEDRHPRGRAGDRQLAVQRARAGTDARGHPRRRVRAAAAHAAARGHGAGRRARVRCAAAQPGRLSGAGR